MSRLIFFPEPLPDEDFRSIVFRYHRMSGNTKLPDTKEELFGTRSYKNPLFPTRLDVLVNRLPIGHTIKVESLVAEHTWAGLVSSFLTLERREEILELIRNGEEKLHQTTLFQVGDLITEKVRYCPDCLAADLVQYGVCYVHRIHQLSIIKHCPIHNSNLIDKCPHCNQDLSTDYAESLIVEPICSSCNVKLQSKQTNMIESKVVLRNLLVLQLCKIRNYSGQINVETILSKIMMKLWELGFIHFGGRIKRLEFLTSLLRELSSDQLEISGVTKEQLVSKHFVGRFLTADHLKSQLLFYTVLILYLFQDVEEFLKYDRPIANKLPYGIGPWECFNTICAGFQKNVIKYCRRSAKRSGGSTVSVEFECPLCGNTYSRLWKQGKDESCKPMVLDMGHQWNERVKSLYLAGHTVYQIKKATGFSECAISSCIKRLKSVSNSINSSENDTTTKDSKVMIMRNILLEAAQKHQTVKRVTLLKKHPREYNWLYFYDREWLDRNFPRKRKVRDKLDLYEYDILLADKIEKLVIQLRQNCNVQIGKYKILNHLSPLEKARIVYLKDRMPQSNSMLIQSVEDLDTYLLRSLNRVVSKLKKKGYKNMTFKALSSYSSLFNRCSHETKIQIEKMLVQLNREQLY